MSWLDRMIAWVSPERAYRRQQWRTALAHQARLGSWRGAKQGRLDRTVQLSGSADADLELGFDRQIMIDQARQLERDNLLAEGLLDRAVENVIDCGHRPQARTEDAGWNERVEELFLDWAEDADIRGLDSFWALQSLIMRSKLRDGDVGCILLGEGRIQPIESDLIATPSGQPLSEGHVDGIDLDEQGRPIRYWVIDEERSLSTTRRYKRATVPIPAEDVLFLARRQRLGQTRGLTVYSKPALFQQLDGYIEAGVVSARMAACFGAVITSPYTQAGLPTETGGDDKTHNVWSLEPGMLKRLMPGETLEQLAPQQPTQSFDSFVASLVRLVGIPMGLPLELALMDFSRTNYSSARAALLQAQKGFRILQRDFISRFLRPIWRWLVERWVDEGRLARREDQLRHEWVPPGWAWLDPVKEIQASLLAVDAGMGTLHDVAMSQGRDFSDLVEMRRRELEMMREAGVPVLHTTMTREPGEDPEPEPEPEGETEAEEELRLQLGRQTRALDEAHAREVELSSMISACLAKADGGLSTPSVVNVLVPEQVVQNDITVQPAPPTPVTVQPAPPTPVTVNLEAAPAPHVTVTNAMPETPVVVENHVHLPEPGPREIKLKVERDQRGRIEGTEGTIDGL